MAAAAQAGLLRQQEELDRKAAELERKERELQSTAASLHGKGSLPCPPPMPRSASLIGTGSLLTVPELLSPILAAELGRILGSLEGVRPERACSMGLAHAQ